MSLRSHPFMLLSPARGRGWVRGLSEDTFLANRNAAASAPTARGSVVVFAKQNALQRQRLAEKQRVYNKARKSAVATRIKKVRCGVYENAEERKN